VADDAPLFCSTCEAPLAMRLGEAHESVCPVCQGRFLDAPATERVVVEEAGVDRGVLADMAAHFGAGKRPCPGCETLLSPLLLRGANVELCTACGGLWCESGALARLSGGRYREVEASDEGDSRRGRSALPERAGEWALVQPSLAPLPLEKVERAFNSFPRLTPADARVLVPRAHGVLIDGLPLGEADALRSLLRIEGVDVERVADAEVIGLPPPFHVFKVDLEDDRMVLIDAFDQVERVRYDEAVAVNAGAVGMKTRRRGEALVRSPVAQLARDATGLGRWTPDADHKRRAANRRLLEMDELMLDVLSGDTRRFRFVSGSFALLSDRPSREQTARFLDGARLLLERLPEQAIGDGARAVTSGEQPAAYRNQRDFDRELGWLRWQGRREV
jgi:Zn-finger nucleic acid-binding protein